MRGLARNRGQKLRLCDHVLDEECCILRFARGDAQDIPDLQDSMSSIDYILWLTHWYLEAFQSAIGHVL